MTIKSIKIDAAWKKAVLLAVVAALIPAVWAVARWSMAGSAVQRVDTADLALYLTQLAPDDPQTHYVAANFLEDSFDPADIEKALGELETATALSPENYILWLQLGRARERSGDAEGAEAALRRALQLAPNYSRVQWALGNALLRQGRIEEAFAEIRKSVSIDQTFAGPAASAAWQFFDGDLPRIRGAMGSSTQFDAALAGLLAREGRIDDAMAVWSEVPAGLKSTTLKETGAALLGILLEAKKFRYAARVNAELNGLPDTVAAIANGGFESAVKPDGAGPFEWQIARGIQPQIVLNSGQKHSGNTSLVLMFNSSDAKELRQVTQTVPVEPGRTYELEVYYRSDLKTQAVFRWDIADASDNSHIAVTDPTLPRAEWTRVAARFKTGERSEGVVVRLVREGCGPVCPISGNLWFDDFSLRAVDR